jgi:thymidylate synthase ThyX
MKTNPTKDIIIIDDLPPEAVAMLQALYSRSPRSVRTHLEQVRTKGYQKFMADYYVGYGHKSIGDCGTTTICIEHVSMLVAKAVQDWALYNGQEASTRYLDMREQPIVDPISTGESHAIQTEWHMFYVKALAALIPVLKVRFPKKETDKDTVYEKAINARAFDIARGFLPAGMTTFVAWHTNLRQAYDHLKEMRHHPLVEVRDAAQAIIGELQTKYSSSFIHKEYTAEETYLEEAIPEVAYYDNPTTTGFSYSIKKLDLSELSQEEISLMAKRPAKAELPNQFRIAGNIDFSFPLDFGSYRDLQRQRSAVQRMPLLTTRHGFYSWYLEQLPTELRTEAEGLITSQEKRIAALDATDEVKQYYIAMGYTVTVKISCPLPSAIYIAELRSSDTVHPTLRLRAQQMGDAIKEAIPGIAMHHDTSPGTWNIKRGLQDIVKKD